MQEELRIYEKKLTRINKSYISIKSKWACSSVGQSAGLWYQMSSVQIQPCPLFKKAEIFLGFFIGLFMYQGHLMIRLFMYVCPIKYIVSCSGIKLRELRWMKVSFAIKQQLNEATSVCYEVTVSAAFVLNPSQVRDLGMRPPRFCMIFRRAPFWEKSLKN